LAAVAEYRYDGLNRRIAKAKVATWDPNNNPETWDRTDYYYNASWQVLEERFTAGQASADTVATVAKYQYVWDLRYIDAPVLRDEDTDADGSCIDSGGSERLYYTTDANMNVTALVNTSGTVVERYVYDPYGKVTIYDPNWDATKSWGDSKKNEILYCGYRYDPETGHYHVRNRYYHPTLGRWLQRDKEGYVDGMSLYEYVRSSPVGYVDWQGLGSEKGTHADLLAGSLRVVEEQAESLGLKGPLPPGTTEPLGPINPFGVDVDAAAKQNFQNAQNLAIALGIQGPGRLEWTMLGTYNINFSRIVKDHPIGCWRSETRSRANPRRWLWGDYEYWEFEQKGARDLSCQGTCQISITRLKEVWEKENKSEWKQDARVRDADDVDVRHVKWGVKGGLPEGQTPKDANGACYKTILSVCLRLARMGVEGNLTPEGKLRDEDRYKMHLKWLLENNEY
jgi:RHS repeat-associated protein